MLFSGIPFLYYFLPAVLLVYFLVPKPLKNGALLLASLVFYGWGEVRYLGLMVGTILAGYGAGLLLERVQKPTLRRLVMVFSAIVLLVPLLFFKYADFFLSNFSAVTGLPIPLLRLTLPLGISFYTFQIISYVIDVYRREVPTQKNPITFGTYVSMFPQLIAGPIVRYQEVAPQLTNRTHSLQQIAVGAERFVLGLGKKVLLANQFGLLCQALRDSEAPSVLFYWMYAIGFTLQLYFDFSGYSDMAIGLGRIFGVSFPENFRYPYCAKSITEFWRRWHITLGAWFRDYVYIPLGGNRVSKPRWILNLVVVWLLTGFWHGADWQFLLWGGLYAVLLLLEKLGLQKLLCRLPKGFCHCYTLFFVVMGFVLFNSEGLSGFGQDITALFGFGGLPAVTGETVYFLQSYGVLLLLGILGAMPLPAMACRWLCAQKIGRAVWVLRPIVLCGLLLLVTAYLVDGSFNPFLYFRF